MPRLPKARYWMLTIPFASEFTALLEEWTMSDLPELLVYVRGQREVGEGGYDHWQLLAVFSSQVTLPRCKSTFGGTAHCEPSRSAAADEYVWKDDTRVDGTQFELGVKPVRRNSKTDWARVRDCAKRGDFDAVPDNVFVQHYRNLKSIASDYCVPVAMERSCVVYWGPTGTGKSRRAWDESGLDAYPKDPRTKWWCGYRGQGHVVIDEFTGCVDIVHLLRWLDRYPVSVETKGGSTALLASKYWITSNLEPSAWYPDVPQVQRDALLRRLEVINIS